MRSFLSALTDNTNTFLAVLSFLMHIPDQHTVVPAASTCRIFSVALHQDECGSCAAFAASTLAAMLACLQSQEDFIPSPFRVFDCSNATCDSGISVILAAAIVNFGVDDIDASPHLYGLPCDLRWERKQQRLHVTNRVIKRASEIQAAILFTGPVIGSMLQPMWRDPETGVYRSLAEFNVPFDPSEKRHAIVVVGWDDAGNWIVQNSWGEEWGDGHGRGRIAPDLLYFAIDPTAHIMNTILICIIAGCLGCMLLTMAMAVCETNPTQAV